MRSMQRHGCFDESGEVSSVMTSWEEEKEGLFKRIQLVIYTAVFFLNVCVDVA